VSDKPLVVILAVGLTPALLGPSTPHLNALVRDGFAAHLIPVFPAVTCSAQSSMLTGSLPREHGIVANGWYFRELGEVLLWRQSNRLVAGQKVWEAARERRPSFRTAKLFWWYNMHSSAELSVTPRPIYPADGRKLPSVYSEPAQLGTSLQRELGTFPLFNFWGPTADIRSSTWITQASAKIIDRERPDLTLIYLPHLDYPLQKLGPHHPDIPREVQALDNLIGILAERARERGAEVVVLSEYGIEAATGVVHVNRALRAAGLLRVQETLGFELLDAGASRAFAVADHQVAHVYVRDAADVPGVAQLLRELPGIERVLDRQGQHELGIDHARSGELVLIAEPGHWFTYYYWLDDAKAPDFARTVDIHRKPGYDPAELFFDPDRPWIKLHAAWILARKSLGFRYLMDVIPLKAELVAGTHGRVLTGDHGPLLICSDPKHRRDSLHQTDVKSWLLSQLFDN